MTRDTKYKEMNKKLLTPFRKFLLVLLILVVVSYALLAFNNTALKEQNLAFTPPIFNTLLICGIVSFMLLLISLLLVAINFVGKKTAERPWLNLFSLIISSLIALALVGICGLYCLLMLAFGFQDAKIIERPLEQNPDVMVKYYVVDVGWLDTMYEFHDYINPFVMTNSSERMMDRPKEFEL